MFDVVVSGGQVIDGTGRAGFPADVGVRRGRIAAIGDLSQAGAKSRIDASGRVVCPGFVDVHTHNDVILPLPEHPQILEPLLRQGITTVVGANCGMGMAPVTPEGRSLALQYLEVITGRDQTQNLRWHGMGEMFEQLEQQGMVLNAGFLAPHGIIRLQTVGPKTRLARPDEVRGMERLLRGSLDDGALGLSTGLMYFPGSQADIDELTALGRVVRERNGVFTSHLRSYSNTIDQAIDEVVEVSRRSGARVQISHLFWLPHVNRLVDSAVNGVLRAASRLHRRVAFDLPLDLSMRPKLERLGKLVREGLPLGIDAMPTSAGFTYLFAFLPPWALAGTLDQILERLTDPTMRKKIVASIERGRSIWPHRAGDTWSMNFFKVMGWRSIHIMGVRSEKNRHLIGRHIEEIAREQGRHPFDVVADLIVEEHGNVLAFETPTHPGDPFLELSLKATLLDPNVSIVTDTLLLGFGRPHHLFYDCYPKFIGDYAVRGGHLSLHEAIRKCTSLPADQLQLRGRGRLQEGYWADLVVFDPAAMRSNSTTERPDQYPDGICHVLVNGGHVVENGALRNGGLHGRVVRRGEG